MLGYLHSRTGQDGLPLDIFITVLLLIGCLSVACGPLRIHTCLIPAKIEPRWITIEYDNPKCTPLQENVFGREFVIPESGFLCTSSPIYRGWHREEYYSVDENNNLTALQDDDRILKRQSFIIIQSSSNAGMNNCKVAGEEFFFGPKEKLTSENPIRKNEAFLKLHPECNQ